MNTFNYSEMLAESHELQQHDFIGLMISKVCEHYGLNIAKWRHGSSADDKLGGDVVVSLKNGKEVLIDLKIAKGERGQRVPLEIERGRNQKALPWSIDGSKGHLVLWLNPDIKWAYVASRKRLAGALLAQSDATRSMLAKAKRCTPETQTDRDKFISPVLLIDRFRFGLWLKSEAIGGKLYG